MPSAVLVELIDHCPNRDWLFMVCSESVVFSGVNLIVFAVCLWRGGSSHRKAIPRIFYGCTIWYECRSAKCM